MKLPTFDDRTLNIFTDASITTLATGEYVSCSGAIAVTGRLVITKIIDEVFQINRNSTNNNGEIIAIIKGVELALKYRFCFDQINLFSDSKICIYGLREWIEKWVMNSRGGTLIGSQNLPVSNQDMIITVVDLILNNNIPIALYHQKGHADMDSKLVKSIMTFKTSNMIDQFITTDYMRVLNQYNNYVDKKSRAVLLDNTYNPIVTPQNLVQYVYDPNMDIAKYLSLVRN